METLDIASLSSRGQLVIPKKFRKKMQLQTGEKFIATGHGDTIVLKKLDSHSVRGLDELLKETRTFAKKHGITRKDVKDAIARARRS